MDTTYYHIIDLNLVGKEEGYVPYIYNMDSGWEVDRKNILMDRVMGYDASEPKDSPYSIGNTYMMSCIEKITEEEANRFISEAKNG